MKTQRILFWGLTALLLGWLANNAVAGERPSQTRTVMRQKLVYSANIIEGITLEKYDLVVSNATKMANMNLTNTWHQTGNKDYYEAARKFELDIIGLIDSATAKDTTAVQSAYTRVTADCIACHRICRKQQIRLPDGSLPAAPAKPPVGTRK